MAKAVPTSPIAAAISSSLLFASLGGYSVPTVISRIQTAGYSVAGLGAASYRRVPAGPATVYRIQSLDGAWWELDEHQIDPAMVGAKVNGKTFGDMVVTTGNLSAATFSGGNHNFTQADVGGQIIYTYTFNSVLYTETNTIASVTGTNAITLTTPAGNAFTSGQGECGSDDSAAIQVALTLCGFASPWTGGSDRTYPPLSASITGGWWQHGPRTVVFRSKGRERSRYCVASPVRLTSGASVRWEGGAWLVALPTFSGSAVLHQQLDGSSNAVDVAQCHLENVQIHCGANYANIGWWLERGFDNTVVGSVTILGAKINGLKIGPDTNANSARVITTSISGGIRVENFGWADATHNNDSTGIGVYITTYAYDNSFDEVKTVSYRVGFKDNGANNHFSGTIHAWTGAQGGYMTTAIITGTLGYYERLYVDTPYNPIGTAIGVTIPQPCTIGEIASTINTAVGTPDNSVTLVQCTYASTHGKIYVSNVHCTSGDNTVKWKAVVDNTAAGYSNLIIENITHDGNVYSVNYSTRIEALTSTVNLQAATITSLQSSVASLQLTATGQPWTPQKIPSKVLGWFDAATTSSLTLNGSSAVSAWASRIGAGNATQSNGSQQPIWSSTGFNSAKPAIVFDGATQMLQALQYFTNQQNIRVFAVFQNKMAAAANGVVFMVGDTSVTSSSGDGFNARMRLQSQTAADFANSGSGTVGSGTVAANALALVSQSLGAAALNTSGSAITAQARLNGAAATNSASSGVTTNITGANIFTTFGGANYNLSGGANAAVALAEIVILTGVLGTSDAEDRQVEGYLAWKWGINGQLPSGHAYYYAAPVNP